MASSLSCHTSRLPTYRSLHVGRFHPYPRGGPRRGEDALMQTVDYRTLDCMIGLDTIPEEPEPVRLRPLVCQEIQGGDVSSFELDYPVVGDASFFEQGVRAEDGDDKPKMSITRLLIAFRRRSLALLGVINFLQWQGERWTK